MILCNSSPLRRKSLQINHHIRFSSPIICNGYNSIFKKFSQQLRHTVGHSLIKYYSSASLRKPKPRVVLELKCSARKDYLILREIPNEFDADIISSILLITNILACTYFLNSTYINHSDVAQHEQYCP